MRMQAIQLAMPNIVVISIKNQSQEGIFRTIFNSKQWLRILYTYCMIYIEKITIERISHSNKWLEKVEQPTIKSQYYQGIYFPNHSSFHIQLDNCQLINSNNLLKHWLIIMSSTQPQAKRTLNNTQCWQQTYYVFNLFKMNGMSSHNI